MKHVEDKKLCVSIITINIIDDKFFKFIFKSLTIYLPSVAYPFASDDTAYIHPRICMILVSKFVLKNNI